MITKVIQRKVQSVPWELIIGSFTSRSLDFYNDTGRYNLMGKEQNECWVRVDVVPCGGDLESQVFLPILPLMDY